MPTRRQLANAIRALSMDAVQRAKSGHPGMPMGMADIAEVLWNDVLKHNPADPNWPDRDRFVLSNGHGSMLIYSLLHLSGYALPREDLQNFRQLHSKTPGHPEYGYAPGVETTTGPLGQGLANAVGMALAEKMLAREFNRPDHAIIDHATYCFVGDGCLMEGISHEACSLAGTLKLSKLSVIYDDNGISIDGETAGWFSDDTPMRFRAYGWHVIENVDGHDAQAIANALREAREQTQKPSLICCKTVIGFGSPNKEGKASSHGAPLGDDEIALTRARLEWPHPPFEIPQDIYAGWDARARGGAQQTAWQERMQAYSAAHPELAAELNRRLAGKLPDTWKSASAKAIANFVDAGESIASRQASLNTLNAFAPMLPELVGGSADLTGSNLTQWQDAASVSDTANGQYIFFGVREFAMSAMVNGLALHGAMLPFAGTFLMFSEYARNALRMAALMRLRAIFVYTHDSIGLGEDGPTHQAVEQAATLRLMPNMHVWRPCDTVESAVAWAHAIEHAAGPSCLLFSRQALTHQTRNDAQLAGIRRGGYVLREARGELKAVLIATGSEVGLAMQAADALEAAGLGVRVVSMPCTNVFDAQDESYRESVLPGALRARVSIEAGVGDYWRKYVGFDGETVSIDTFGESAPADELFKHFGFTVDNVVKTVQRMMARLS